MLKKFLILLIGSLVSLSAYAQRFYSVVFTALPQDYQLYPRNDKNEASVPIKGYVEIPGYNYASVVVLRDNQPLRYLKAPITYDTNGNGHFTTESTIKAELAEYDFKVYVCKTADSVLMVHRKSVVSGDVYLIAGQSNSLDFNDESALNKFCRTFGVITSTLNTDPYNPQDTLWALSNQSQYINEVGSMGFEIQKRLVDEYKIPSCLINAGAHWSSAAHYAFRNADNPTDLTTRYGRMLYRIQKAGVTQAIKSFIYRQGETEAYGEASDWEGNFEKFRTNLKADFPNLKKIYVFQIDVIYHPTTTGALVRDYQRRLEKIHPDLQSLATVGTKGFDGLHYTPEGYQQNGAELFRLIARDFYASPDTLGIGSPNPRKVFYNEDKTRVTIVYDKDQQVRYPDPYKPNSQVTLDMKDFFYLDNVSGKIASGYAEENRVVLNLSGTQTAKTLDYLPPFLQENGSYYPFTGPYITNSRGLRAFTFYKVPIANGLKTPVLTLTAASLTDVNISWNAIPDATSYVVERKLSEEIAYRVLATLDPGSLNYIDQSAPFNSLLSYRLRAVTAESESSGTAEINTSPVMGFENPQADFITAFPNPIRSGEDLNVKLNHPVSGSAYLIDLQGRQVSGEVILKNQETGKLLTGKCTAGNYILVLKTKNATYSKPILIR